MYIKRSELDNGDIITLNSLQKYFLEDKMPNFYLYTYFIDSSYLDRIYNIPKAVVDLREGE
jgi:hypothetical protein